MCCTCNSAKTATLRTSTTTWPYWPQYPHLHLCPRIVSHFHPCILIVSASIVSHVSACLLSPVCVLWLAPHIYINPLAFMSRNHHLILCSQSLFHMITEPVHRTCADSSSTFLRNISKPTSYSSNPFHLRLPLGTTHSYNSHQSHIWSPP